MFGFALSTLGAIVLCGAENAAWRRWATTRWLDGPMTGADVSARVAWAEDAPAIAAVQVRAWRTSYADLLPAEVLEALDAGDSPTAGATR